MAPAEMYPASAASEAESIISDNIDFSKLFEEDIYANEGEDALDLRPIAPSMANAEGSSNLSSSCVEAPSPAPAASFNQLQAQTQQDANQLVNVLFIVDPTTQQIIVPRQLLQQQALQQQLEQLKMSTNATSFLMSNEPRTVSPSSVTEPRISMLSSFPLPLPNNLSFLNNSNRNSNTSNCTLVTNGKAGCGTSNTTNILHRALRMQMQQDLNIKLAQQAASVTTNSNTTTSSIAAASEPPPPKPQPQSPLRALSAYNYFFCSEREHILNGSEPEYSVSKQDRLLQEHWGRDRTKKRRHRKTHGKIDFTTLSKRISAAWKALSEEHKDFYRQVAARDWERYQDELGRYKEATSSSLIVQVPTNNNNNNEFMQISR